MSLARYAARRMGAPEAAAPVLVHQGASCYESLHIISFDPWLGAGVSPGRPSLAARYHRHRLLEVGSANTR